MILGVNPSRSINSVQDLIKAAKARPGTLKYATAGSGSPMHMGGEIFKDLTGVDIIHVPYSGGGPALISLIGGETDIAFDTAASITAARALRQIESARDCAHEPARRVPEHSDVRRGGIAGLRGQRVVLDARAGRHAGGDHTQDQPPTCRDPSNCPTSRKNCASSAATASATTPEHFGAFVRAELDKYRKLIAKAGIKVE